jgi:diguanylate cyclase (GGDEF)-like protein
LREVTRERQSAEQRLQHNTTHDALTGLRNRATFAQVVGSALEFQGGLRDFSVGVLFLDIDRMKQINDSLGATTGDLVLVEIAKRLQNVLSAEDVLARVGGDEFAILAAFQDPAGANVLADRLLRDLRKPFVMNGVELVVGASIGIALSGPKQQGDLLAGAAAACYRAKQQGRGRWVLFEDAMRDRARNRIHLEAELRAAVARHEFLVFYEPVVSLATGRLAGFEALVRWQHPERGMVSPGEFIPVAEETDLIVPIDRWVLVEAARCMREWHDRFGSRSPLSISVNLSGAGLTEAGLVDHVKKTLKATGLNPRFLKMELTESSVVEAGGAGETVLRALRECGVRLSLDDFGTGYSSFAYIQQFAFDTVKIDRSFIRAIDSDPRSREIVETITNLAHSLSMDVVAEGPDSAAHIAVLRELKCDYAQGWHFSKPQDRDKTTRFIEQDPVW